ncbi:MAG TPA: hypothetical protein VJ761_14025 [Ktedonobacteraceae bacterium]|nr:hypothetical protein [Ktedonobacteraceae bacterium]
MAETRKPVIYIRYNGENYYVGQSKNADNRGAHGTGKLVALFPASADTHERHLTETEMIQFCKAAGLPLSNILQLKEPVVGIKLDEEYG